MKEAKYAADQICGYLSGMHSAKTPNAVLGSNNASRLSEMPERAIRRPTIIRARIRSSARPAIDTFWRGFILRERASRLTTEAQRRSGLARSVQLGAQSVTSHSVPYNTWFGFSFSGFPARHIFIRNGSAFKMDFPAGRDRIPAREPPINIVSQSKYRERQDISYPSDPWEPSGKP